KAECPKQSAALARNTPAHSVWVWEFMAGRWQRLAGRWRLFRHWVALVHEIFNRLELVSSQFAGQPGEVFLLGDLFRQTRLERFQTRPLRDRVALNRRGLSVEDFLPQ